MTRRDWLAPAVIGIIILLAALLWLAPHGLSKAPAVSFKLLDGNEYPLADWHGKPVLVTFWATDCPGCIREIPHLIELYEEFNNRGFQIVAVAMSYDPPNRVVEFNRRRELPYYIALDIDGRIAQAFGNVMLTPTTFLIAPDGRIVTHKIGEFDTDNMRQQIAKLLQQT
ncbi:MAG: TlpA disulfide reductase family protein, partial [Gammaproteobacteria bacterium]